MELTIGFISIFFSIIIPISKANTEEEAIKLNHYTNFQLLPKEYNRNIKKDSNFNRIDFENWLLWSKSS